MSGASPPYRRFARLKNTHPMYIIQTSSSTNVPTPMSPTLVGAFSCRGLPWLSVWSCLDMASTAIREPRSIRLGWSGEAEEAGGSKAGEDIVVGGKTEIERAGNGRT